MSERLVYEVLQKSALYKYTYLCTLSGTTSGLKMYEKILLRPELRRRPRYGSSEHSPDPSAGFGAALQQKAEGNMKREEGGARKKTERRVGRAEKGVKGW